MKPLIAVLLFILSSLFVSAQSYENTLDKLDEELENSTYFVQLKHQEIGKLKKNVNQFTVSGNTKKLYGTYIDLFKEYSKFKYDSAYFYLEKAKSIALKQKNDTLLSNVRINESFILLSSGLFKEAIDTLNNIDTTTLTHKQKFKYYSVKARSYFDLSDYNRDSRFTVLYTQKGNRYLEKALLFATENTNDYWYAKSLLALKKQDLNAARTVFENWINNYQLSSKYLGIATSSLGYIYAEQNNPEKAIEYFAKAAIADIKFATKETTALRNLAFELYKVNDLERANKYIHLAMDDATFYNARHRKIQISSILPIIEKAQLYNMERHNKVLERIVIILTVLSIAVLILLVIIFKQLKSRNRSRKELQTSYNQLAKLNSSLRELDAIKQEYITYFIQSTSDLIKRINTLKKSVQQKILSKKMDDALRILNTYNTKEERKNLFNQFDEIFLQLFPTFINDFNQFFDEEQEHKKGNELLNTELRIYALYRLGIQDSNQIASFFDLSVSTIYSYKTRIKSRSRYKDNFEEKVMEIPYLGVREDITI
ncbi:DUF6377 domain-containing protein [Galbibacter mesophilus]|uniref:DUF6377 domain-containing protein n=1 Tax=Galbibacter mesophilus TaxID=379069 RepID=UPI00191E5D09|nr:DUF6377 domain-containing protein [Galbibacter mesophilus]MCM5663457.1 DUF6377 domain-containing protein [Galbibacter mesophilus]